MIPDRGAWLDFSLASGEIVSVNIDNRKKLPVTLLFKAFGAENNDSIISLFGAEPTFMEFEDEIRGRLSAAGILDPEGNVIVARGRPVTREALETLARFNPGGRGGIDVLGIDPSLALTLEKDVTQSSDEATLEIFRRLRPNEPARIENAREYLKSLFFDPRRYTLGRVGRYKLNRRLGLDIDADMRLLTLKDLAAIVRELFSMKAQIGRAHV